MGSRHPSLVARRFKSIMPNAKVVMVIRNQITALSSWYANHGSFKTCKKLLEKIC